MPDLLPLYAIWPLTEVQGACRQLRACCSGTSARVPGPPGQVVYTHVCIGAHRVGAAAPSWPVIPIIVVRPAANAKILCKIESRVDIRPV